MASRVVKALVLSAALVVPLALSACSGGEEAAPSSSSASASSSGSSTPSPSVSVDEEVKEALTLEEGEAIIPGTIESVEQTLSPECTAAVAPLREVMGKYKSGFELPVEERVKLANETMKAAKEACGGDASQDWVNFYNLEFAGWLYAKVD